MTSTIASTMLYNAVFLKRRPDAEMVENRLIFLDMSTDLTSTSHFSAIAMTTMGFRRLGQPAVARLAMAKNTSRTTATYTSLGKKHPVILDPEFGDLAQFFWSRIPHHDGNGSARGFPKSIHTMAKRLRSTRPCCLATGGGNGWWEVGLFGKATF